jgi:hypothetical protein
MLRTRKRIWYRLCGSLFALILALGPIGAFGGVVASAQGSADDAEDLLATATELIEDLEPLDAPRTLTLEQSESDTITVNFLNPEDEPLTDFYLSYRAEAPRDGDDEPFDITVYFRDQGNGEPYVNLVLVSSSGDRGQVYAVFNEEGLVVSDAIDEDIFPIEEGSRYNVELAVIGDEAAFAINGEPVALFDISDNPGAGRVAMASGIFGNTQIEGESVEISRIQLYDLGGSDDADDVDEDEQDTDEDETVVDEGEGDTDEDDASSGDTETAESEIYGFTVDFDPNVWELRDITQTGQNYSTIGMDNVEIFDFVDGRTQVLFFAGESSDTPRECVDRDIEYFDETSSRYDFVGVAEDDEGDAIRGRTASGDGYYAVIYLDDNGPADNEFEDPEPITVYIECRPIVEGESMILIEHYARDAVYNDAIEARIDLLAGIEVSGGSSTNDDDEDVVEDDEEEVIDEDEEDPVDDEDESVDGPIVVEITGDVEGEATIEPAGSTRSRVIVVVEGADEGALVVIQEGSCRRLAGEPAFEVDEIDDQGEASGRIRITPAELVGDYAITIIDPDTEDYEEPLGCGDIE